MVVKKLSKKAPVENPEVVEDAKVETFKQGTALLGTVLNPENEFTFSVKLDTKKFEGRVLSQVLALVDGSAGAVKKIIIEQE